MRPMVCWYRGNDGESKTFFSLSYTHLSLWPRWFSRQFLESEEDGWGSIVDRLLLLRVGVMGRETNIIYDSC